MAFEKLGGHAAHIIEGLARKIDRQTLRADAIAEKIASPDRERRDFVDYEIAAEAAQKLATEQKNWETLLALGFVK